MRPVHRLLLAFALPFAVAMAHVAIEAECAEAGGNGAFGTPISDVVVTYALPAQQVG